MMSIICPTIRMCEVKYFYYDIVYIVNECYIKFVKN